MTLIDYLRVLRRRAVVILITTLVVGAAAVAYSSQQPRVYAASTQLITSVSASSSDGSGGTSQRPLAAEQAQSLARIANTPPALAAAADAAGVSAAGVAVEATADNTSPFLEINVTGRDPAAVAAVANAYAKTLPQVAEDLNQLDPGSAVRLIPLRPAVASDAPVSPRPVRNALAGLAVGLALGVGLVFFLTALDRQVRDSGDIEDSTGLAVLGAIPLELASEPLPALSHPASTRAEAYRLVRTNLQFTDVAKAPRTVLVTSPAPGDGKTSLACNLAASCAQAGERTVIVDADLRRPRVARQFGLSATTGLAQFLSGSGDEDLDGILHEVSPELWVLPAGLPPKNPSEQLGRPALAMLLSRLGHRFDRVIIDAPPVLAVADALRISTSVAGVLLVARTNKTTVDELVSTRKRLEKASACIFGVVANGVVPGRDSAYGYGAYGDEAYGEGFDPADAAAPTSRRARRRSGS